MDFEDVTPSPEYRKFKEEEKIQESENLYEKLCRISYRILPLKAPKFIVEKVRKPIFVSDLKATPDSIFSLMVFTTILSIVGLIPGILFLSIQTVSILFLIPPILLYLILTYPKYYSDVIRIRAGNETVKIILYMAIYLSLNPLFSSAFIFSSKHSSGPLGRDMKKIVWDVELGKYPNIRSGISAYSKKWSYWNDKFVEAINVLQDIEIASSRFEREKIIEKALSMILRSNFIQMKNYSKQLRSPVMMIHSFGLIMPVLGLVMFPLISIFLTSQINPLYIGFGYIVVLPLILWELIYRTISKRPGAFSHSNRAENVTPQKYLHVKKLNINLPIFHISLLIGILIMIPGIMYYISLATAYIEIHSSYPEDVANQNWRIFVIQSYSENNILINTFKAMFVVWGLSAFIILNRYLRSYKAKKLEDFIREIEKQFQVGLFQLGSSLGNNLPIENSIIEVLSKYRDMGMENTPIYAFFKKILKNIQMFSMSFGTAAFHKVYGVINMYPSSVIKDVMKVLSISLDKGPQITSRVAKSIASYLEKIDEIEEMIRDILDEVISSLKMHASFISPFICGVVTSMSILIVQVLQQIAVSLQKLESILNIGGVVTGLSQGLSTSLSLIKLEEVLPPTVLQLIVGVYLVEIVVIISSFLNGIENGFDKVSEDITVSKNLLKATIFYSIVTFIMIIFFQPLIQQIVFR